MRSGQGKVWNLVKICKSLLLEVITEEVTKRTDL